ncbi:quinone-dependent dihydroorotate dehydrogenase [Anaerolineales bacterium]
MVLTSLEKKMANFKLNIADFFYRRLIRPVLFRLSNAQRSHEQILAFIGYLDDRSLANKLLQKLNQSKPVDLYYGGVHLSHPFILAAGFVKGMGFENEAEALKAVDKQNIIPGWKSVPHLVGQVELGSYTAYPRLGNEGTVIWRDVKTKSTQNRVGLKNPGAKATALFLAKRRHDLPPVFGINIAVSPGVSDLDQQVKEVQYAIDQFISNQVFPSWFTLNISCPNTEDDPSANQTEKLAESLGQRLLDKLNQLEKAIPLWVKISPDLSALQYQRLADTLAKIGVSAIVIGNTLAMPTPDDANLMAGVGGGKLFPQTQQAAEYLADYIHQKKLAIDLIACCGILDGEKAFTYQSLGIQAYQYWSALIYRGPFAARILEKEVNEYIERNRSTTP